MLEDFDAKTGKYPFINGSDGSFKSYFAPNYMVYVGGDI